jgi:hypothetical protein
MERSFSMKKMRLILTTLILSLIFTISAGICENVYADGETPQGTSTSTKTQPAPEKPQPAISDSMLMAVFWALSSLPW